MKQTELVKSLIANIKSNVEEFEPTRAYQASLHSLLGVELVGNFNGVVEQVIEYLLGNGYEELAIKLAKAIK